MDKHGSWIIWLSVETDRGPFFATTMETAESQGWLKTAKQIEVFARPTREQELRDRFAALSDHVPHQPLHIEVMEDDDYNEGQLEKAA